VEAGQRLLARGGLAPADLAAAGGLPAGVVAVQLGLDAVVAGLAAAAAQPRPA
jgi:hypothetical protein